MVEDEVMVDEGMDGEINGGGEQEPLQAPLIHCPGASAAGEKSALAGFENLAKIEKEVFTLSSSEDESDHDSGHSIEREPAPEAAPKATRKATSVADIEVKKKKEDLSANPYPATHSSQRSETEEIAKVSQKMAFGKGWRFAFKHSPCQPLWEGICPWCAARDLYSTFQVNDILFRKSTKKLKSCPQLIQAILWALEGSGSVHSALLSLSINQG